MENKTEEVLAENVNEGYCIVYEDGSLSPMIEWVEWIEQTDGEEDILVEVTFSDDTVKTFEKGEKLRQIWHEDIV